MAARPRPSPTRASSGPHTPAAPSGLRQSHTSDTLQPSPSTTSGNGGRELADSTPTPSGSNPQRTAAPTETTALLRDVIHAREHVHPGPCHHGTFSPRPMSPSSSSFQIPEFGPEDMGDSRSSTPSALDGLLSNNGDGGGNDSDWKRKWAKRIRSRKMQTSRALAERHGLQNTTLMYLSYYIPCISWMKEYKLSYLHGDFISALTIAGIYLPLAMSLADGLAHVPAINGLYGFVFQPLFYALLGSSPQLVVGPEAAGSLLVGTVVRTSVDLGRGDEDDDLLHAKICGIVTGLAAAVVLIAGLARLGFLDSILSRPFLRGFISAIGFVIGVDQLIPELGLVKAMAEAPGVSHGSSVDKLRFMFSNLDKVHRLTLAVAVVSFTTIMVFRVLKSRLQKRYPGVAYVPDRLTIVIISAVLCWHFGWEDQGLEVLGAVKAASGHSFTFRWPFRFSHLVHIRDAMSTSFLIALLGFFESSVAAKGLGGQEIFPGIQLSANRELVALGISNLVGGCFMALPAFGGYGRSKVNKATGGISPLSSILLSIITVICIMYLLPYFYYIPKPTLSAMLSVVAWSLIEECPADVAFFLRIRAWQELALMFVIVVATIFYSLNMGIAIGIGLSLLLVLRHATRPRIQILGRIPGTQKFENAEDDPERLEFIEGCLIVKIPEPLTFANTGELKSRLRRLELYGTNEAHPALPRLRREDSNRNIIFDIHGVTSMDGSGTQVLSEIVGSYRERGVRVFFSRGPDNHDHPVWKLMERSGIVALVGGEDYFVSDVQEALKMTEVEERTELGSFPAEREGPPAIS